MSLESAEINPHGWIKGYVSGDEVATEKLANHVVATLQRKIRRLGVSPQDVEDLSQACAMEVLRRMKEYDPSRGQLESWIGGFALNAVRMHRRAMAGRKLKDLPIEEMPNLGYEVAAATTRKDLLLRALETIDIVDRELLHLRFALNLSSAEIAVVSNMNAAQARKRISRAVEKLRQHGAVQQLLT